MRLIERFEIVRVLPCIADTAKIRVVARCDSDIGEALPYLNATVKGTTYNPGSKSLSVQRDGMRFNFFPDGVTAVKLRDLDHARAELQGWTDRINETWENRGEITPSFERGTRLTVLQVYKALPATNCRRCGEISCLAFAAGLVADEVSVLACRPLFEATGQERRRALLELLDSRGRDVPAEFLA